MRGALGGGLLLGCSAGGVIGGGRELEEQPGLSLTAAALPGVTRSRPFHLRAQPARAAGAAPTRRRTFLLLPDPFTFDVDELLHALDAAYPDSTSSAGSRAAGARRAATRSTWATRSTARGLVGVALTGNVAVDTIVAQGCRPIGEPMFVTRCERNVIHELDGRRAGERAAGALRAARARDDRQLFRTLALPRHRDARGPPGVPARATS